MINVIWGVAALVISALLIFASFLAHRKERPTVALVLIVLCGLTLRIYDGTDLFLHKWDEEFHALVARNCLRHPLVPTLIDDPVIPDNYQCEEAGRNHIWLHKPPVATWIMALSMRLFGVNEIALRLPSITLSTIAVSLTYSIGRQAFDTPVGLLAAFFHATNGFLIRLAGGRQSTDHVDTIFIFLIELGAFVCLAYRRNASWILALTVGIICGIAVETKWLTGLLILVIFAVAAYGRKSLFGFAFDLFVAIAAALVIIVPWQVYINTTFPVEARIDAACKASYLFKGIGHHARPIYYHVANMGRMYGVLVLVPAAWFLYYAARRWRERVLLCLAAWFSVPYVFFSIAVTKMPAYVAVCAPVVFVAEAAFLRKLWAVGTGGRPLLRWLRAALLAGLVIAPLLQCMLALQPFKIRARNPRWTQQLRSLRPRFGEGKVVLFNMPRPRPAMFYSGYPAYGFVPSEAQIKAAEEKGYTVVVYDDGSLPPYVRASGVRVIRAR
jgi:4-amino-4-deoxy-L-arabinose transferase-like glycosyltransferase